MESGAMGWRGLSTPLQALVAVVVVCLLCLQIQDLPFFRQGTSVTVPDHITMDEVIRGDWNDDPGPLRFFPTSCQPQSNLVFIKCLQCSPGVVDMVFRRHGYVNNLPVALPVGERVYLGWPRPVTVGDVRPSSRGYSLLSEPAVYNRTFMTGLMKRDAVFFTMIRHPLDLLVSTLSSFRMLEAASLTWSDGVTALQTYIRNLKKYDGVFTCRAASPKRSCFPDGFSLTQNLMSHCLGMPLGFPKDRQDISPDVDAVWDYIHSLDPEFLLVMIMEYVDESLVLLKRLMCWSFKDILHLGSREKGCANILSALTQHDRDLHRQWSQADYVLYDHFNRTFWEKVEQHGENFWEDLAYYQYLQKQVRWFCRKVTPYGESSMQFPETVVYPAFNVTSEDCRLMEAPLLDMLKTRYLQQQSQSNDSSVYISKKKAST